MTSESFIAAWADNIDGLAAEKLNPDTELASLPQWDSLAVLTTLAFLDANYNVQTDGPTVQSCRTLADLHALATGQR
jgi:acyl carrier protein